MKVDFLRGAHPQTERERQLLSQIGCVRHFLARAYKAAKGHDRYCDSTILTILQCVRRNHPKLKEFYRASATTSAPAGSPKEFRPAGSPTPEDAWKFLEEHGLRLLKLSLSTPIHRSKVQSPASSSSGSQKRKSRGSTK